MKLVMNRKVFILLVLLALAVSAITLGLVFGLQKKDKRIVGAVVSNGRGCAEVGGQMLDDGGSAVDAAIATLLCEGVILPHSMGIGGGFVATIYTKKTGKIETLIARESAPAAAHKDMFVGQDEITGAISSGVPGELLGYHELHQNYGRLPWKKLFQPTIALCEKGHLISRFLATTIKTEESKIRNEPTLAEVFLKSDGTLYQEGDILKRQQLGKTLEIIAEKGVKEFYGGGELGKMFVEDIQELGGIITEKDLREYRTSWSDKDHVMANITENYILYSTPLPTSGAVLAFMLNVLNLKYTDNYEHYWQRGIETFKHAYGRRTNLGDLENEQDSAEIIRTTFNNLIDQNFAKEISSLIFDDRTFEDFGYYGANFTNEEDHGTANVAVLAPNGDAIVVTSTINNNFGAKVVSRRTGIILNDQMDDFSIPGHINSYGVPASPANYIHPSKRPMSSMCPSIILDKAGNVRMLVGAAGGTKITTSVATAIVKYLILNHTISQAVNDWRLHHQLAPMVIEAETGLPLGLKTYLENVGHKINLNSDFDGFSAVTAIGVRNDFPEPQYDRRRVGSATAGAVPGELLGYHEMHQKHGRLPWKNLFTPTIKLCKEGHWVSRYLAAAIKSKESIIRNEPSLAEVFIKPDGTLYQEGDTMKREQLGKTLEIIAEKGVKEFYGGGELGKLFVEDIQELGGIITEKDLMDYRVRWEDQHHVVANVTGGYTLYTTPLPSSGALLAFILNVMTDLYTDNHEVYWQRVIETFKHAYGHRTNLGDLENEIDMKETIQATFNDLISQDFANSIRPLIYDDKTFEDFGYYGANFTNEEDHGTAHMAVLAANGDAVSITSTINNYFGCKVRSRRTGIILNDEMDDFSTPGVVNSFGVPASPANYIKPSKRPMSSMCPAIILDKAGNVRMLVGAAGGTKITTSVATSIIKYLIFNETMSQAVNDGRLHHQLAPMRIDVESEVAESTKNYLGTVGHKLNILPEGSGFAALTAIGVRTGIPEPFFDRRRVGSTTTIEAKNKMSH